jgi:hypothetical protein
VQPQDNSFELGGLNDDDLEESYPLETEGAQKHVSCGSEVCDHMSCALSSRNAKLNSHQLVKIGAKTNLKIGKHQAMCKVSLTSSISCLLTTH